MAKQKAKARAVQGKPLSIEDLLELGKERGHISYEELNNSLPDEAISPEKIDEILLQIDEMGVELIDENEVKNRKGPDMETPGVTLPARHQALPVDIGHNTTQIRQGVGFIPARGQDSGRNSGQFLQAARVSPPATSRRRLPSTDLPQRPPQHRLRKTQDQNERFFQPSESGLNSPVRVR